MSTPVLVFGPTGHVGSIAAQTAQQNGAKVWLAMRDPSKTIKGISADEEKAGGYERVQADLSKADTVAAAVQKSGAKHAFIYVNHGSDMRDIAQALKSNGVTFVVLLSSFTVYEPLNEVPPEEVIPYFHAKVEVTLEEIYGRENFVALRPGAFATNMLQYKAGILAGEVPMYGATFQQDGITYEDMGRVAGTILAKGMQDGQSIVYLYGPQITNQADMAQIISKAIGKGEVKIVPQSPEQARKMFTERGLPPPIMEYLLKRLGDNEAEAAPRREYEQGVENIKKYTGQPALGFADWVQKNKDLFVE